MCAEFTPGQPMEIEKLIHAALIIKEIIQFDFEKRIYPGQIAPIIIRNDNSELELTLSEFSLIPEWWNPEKAEKKKKNGRPLFATHNARIETIHEKPAFRKSFEKRHCLVPIKKFFESSLFGDKFSGHRISIQGKELLLAAGCFNEWVHPSTGEIISSFTIVTKDPARDIFQAGHDRMPIFLNIENSNAWLSMKDVTGKKSQEFLLQNYLKAIDFQIEVDRPLKSGWEKNAPDEKYIQEISERIKDRPA